MTEQTLTRAQECNCVRCGKQAVAFFPIFDPDIPSYPYREKCLYKTRYELMIKLHEIDVKYNEHERQRNNENDSR